MKKTNSEWAKTLEPEQFLIMREEGTEMPGSSNLNDEKRKGFFHCANCGAKLFASNAKFDSGTGWPSFTESLPGAFKTKIDYSFYKLLTNKIYQSSFFFLLLFQNLFF